MPAVQVVEETPPGTCDGFKKRMQKLRQGSQRKDSCSREWRDRGYWRPRSRVPSCRTRRNIGCMVRSTLDRMLLKLRNQSRLLLCPPTNLTLIGSTQRWGDECHQRMP